VVGSSGELDGLDPPASAEANPFDHSYNGVGLTIHRQNADRRTSSSTEVPAANAPSISATLARSSAGAWCKRDGVGSTTGLDDEDGKAESALDGGGPFGVFIIFLP
jgi:hypothetical protein